MIEDEEQEQDVVVEVPGAGFHKMIRGTSKCGLIIVGALTASVLVRLVPQLIPFYGVCVALGAIGLLTTLALGRDPENKAFALTVASLVTAGMLLGSWDWLAYIFTDASGASVIYQAGILIGIILMGAALQKSLSSAGYSPPWEGGYRE